MTVTKKYDYPENAISDIRWKYATKTGKNQFDTFEALKDFYGINPSYAYLNEYYVSNFEGDLIAITMPYNPLYPTRTLASWYFGDPSEVGKFMEGIKKDQLAAATGSGKRYQGRKPGGSLFRLGYREAPLIDARGLTFAQMQQATHEARMAEEDREPEEFDKDLNAGGV